MKDYTLLNPVFQINGARDFGGRRDLCIVPYIRLEESATMEKAIRILREELAKKYDVPLERVVFHFWSDGCVMGGGAPQVIS